MSSNKKIESALVAVEDENVILQMTSLISQLELQPDAAGDICEQAKLLLKFGQFEAALSLLAQAANSQEIAEMRRSGYASLARWALESGELALVEWATDRFLWETPDAPELWTLRGEAASMRGEDSLALDYFNRASQLSPQPYAQTAEQERESNRLMYLRVAALVRLRRYAEAWEHFSAAINRDETNSDLWYLGAVCLVQTGRNQDALPLCQRALACDPRHIDAGKLKRNLESARR